VGTNFHYIHDAKKIVEQAPELKEMVMDGTLNIPEAKVAAKMFASGKLSDTLAALQSSESNEWYTPAQYVNAARELMGTLAGDVPFLFLHSAIHVK